jgi:hypothetical protein
MARMSDFHVVGDPRYAPDAPSGGGGSTVSITPALSEGVKIADYSIDGEPGELYVPDSSKVYSGSTPPSEANEGDLFVRKTYKDATTQGVLTSGGGINIDSVNEDNYVYNVNAHFIDDTQTEAIYVKFEDLTVGQTYTFNMDMSISGRMQNWDKYFYCVACTSQYHGYGSDLNPSPPVTPGGTITTLSDGWAITLYYDNNSHNYNYSFVADSTTVYVLIEMSYLVNVYSGIDRDVVIHDLSLTSGASQKLDKVQIKQVFADGQWRTLNNDGVTKINQTLTSGEEIARAVNGDGTETIIYSKSIKANPTGTATDTLNTIEIDGAIYGIEGGGGGGGTGSGYTETTLYQSDTNESVYNLSDDISNYDLLYLEGGYNASGNELRGTAVLSVVDVIDGIANGKQYGISNDAYYTYVKPVSNVQFIRGTYQSTMFLRKIIGIKFGSGSGASNLSDLSDVDLSNLSDGQILQYNSTSEKWENADSQGSLPFEFVIDPNDNGINIVYDDSILNGGE